jgi:hypothetical protein
MPAGPSAPELQTLRYLQSKSPRRLTHRTSPKRDAAQRAYCGPWCQEPVPTIYQRRETVESGSLISFGPSLVEMWRQTGVLVGKILRGTRSATPIQQSGKFELSTSGPSRPSAWRSRSRCCCGRTRDPLGARPVCAQTLPNSSAFPIIPAHSSARRRREPPVPHQTVSRTYTDRGLGLSVLCLLSRNYLPCITFYLTRSGL